MNNETRELLAACLTDDPPIDLTPQQDEKFCMLLADDEEQILTLKQQVSFMKVMMDCDLQSNEATPGPISKQTYKHFLETSELCHRLADRIEEFGGRAKHLLQIMGNFYAIKAEQANPKGKRHKKSMPQDYVAGVIVSLIAIDQIEIATSINANSDLSKLFRLCCELVGIRAPSNTAFYLKPQLEALSKRVPEDTKLLEIEQQAAEILDADLPLWLDEFKET